MSSSNQQWLDEIKRSWVLRANEIKQKKFVNLGFVVLSRQAVKRSFWTIVVVFLVVALPTIVVKCWPKHEPGPPPPDKYHLGLQMALRFFDEQKSGRLLNDNNTFGSELADVNGGIVGGYYDSQSKMKPNFPMSFSISLLSWSVLEYSHKYKAIGEYDHVREIIKWGTDYLLRTFNSSGTKITKIYSQVGVVRKGSRAPNGQNCWERAEDMNYTLPVQIITTEGADLASEMAAALASASMVFIDDTEYSKKLIKGATMLFEFGLDKQVRYSTGNQYIEQFYNSSGFYDEYIWGAAWMFYSTGNSLYLSVSTDPSIAKKAEALSRSADKAIFNWDKKLPGAELLLTRLRIFLNPGFPYEMLLERYHYHSDLIMCSYLKKYNVYNFTRGGFILMDGGHQNLQNAVNAAFLASMFVDYLKAARMPGWYCGTQFVGADELHNFATSQVNYILEAKPRKMCGNAGLVSALVALTTTGGSVIDTNTIFSRVPPLSPASPAPPPPWKPLDPYP
ncbi:hypothetical protein MKW92_005586 [Papaver armeniacum]|nr:hypothetical protein MKW92_005586 [Papaver armeniacum]